MMWEIRPLIGAEMHGVAPQKSCDSALDCLFTLPELMPGELTPNIWLSIFEEMPYTRAKHAEG
jgi:hypothetical protein